MTMLGAIVYILVGFQIHVSSGQSTTALRRQPTECPSGRVIHPVVRCGGGRGRVACPASSHCINPASDRYSFCCWDESSIVSSPCMYPLMRGSDFHTCNGAVGTGCPGSCHNCTMLPGGFTLGLCCPLSRRECLRYHSSSASVSGTSFTGGAGGAGVAYPGLTGGMGGAGAMYPGLTGRMGREGPIYPGLTGGTGSTGLMYPGLTPGAGGAGPISPLMRPGSFLPAGGGGASPTGAIPPGSGFRPIGPGMPPGGGMPPTGGGVVSTGVRMPPVAGGPLPPGAIPPGPGFRPIGPGMSGPMIPTSGVCFGTTPPLGVCIGPMEICPPYARCVTGIGGRRICCPMGPTMIRGPIGSPLVVPGYPRRRPGMR